MHHELGLNMHQLHLIQPGWAIDVSIVIWCVFAIYWEQAAKTASKAITQESRGSRRIHLIVVTAAQFLLFFRVPGLNGNWLPRSPIPVASGLALEIAGFLMAIWARRCLGRHWSGEITVKLDHELVRTGPYKFVRHPIYSALLMMYLGVAIVSGELHALVGFLLVVVAYLRKIGLEEANLKRVFGDKYEEYHGQTRALVPGVY